MVRIVYMSVYALRCALATSPIYLFGKAQRNSSHISPPKFLEIKLFHLEHGAHTLLQKLLLPLAKLEITCVGQMCATKAGSVGEDFVACFSGIGRVP